jgi:hypothetical protein
MWMLLAVTALLFAKGEMVRIVIRGEGLPKPIEIKDATVMNRFQIYSGPGTSRDGVRETGTAPTFIIDWPRGAVDEPKGLRVYEVSFVTTRSDVSTYIVFYAFDPATKHGYVYLPGRSDPQYKDNVWQIYRGVEGKWFHAWSAWDEVAQPLLQ